ncbi:hypothetical protein DSO57_1024563 [Entomophthora muscae]|uniref:Uncharacterized protein n=1 Tax=Entomophthora muscae TaxID=34485 RepID=A0ACC2RHJ2_9FUNG|nr:hypothetical protein DSO57_1024563 [Entomophthora muscae]
MKFTGAPSLPPLGNSRNSSLGAIIIEPVLVFWIWDLAGASACGGSISEKHGQADSQSMGPAARRNLGSGFKSCPWAQVLRAHTVDERFVLAYPAEPLLLVAPSWEETLVNLDYLLAWYCTLLKTIRAGQSEVTTLTLSNTSEFQMTSASSSQSDLTAEIGMKPSSPPSPA